MSLQELAEVRSPHGIPLGDWISQHMSDEDWRGPEGTAIMRMCAQHGVPDGYRRDGAARHLAALDAAGVVAHSCVR